MVRIFNSTAALLAIGIGIAVVVLVLALGPALRRDVRSKQILATGTPAEARVIDLKDTMVRYNGQPQFEIRLEVMPQGRPAFQAVVKQIVSLADLDLYARGRTLEVKFDPAHPDQVAIVDPAQH